jgi:hypothetical protein
MVNTEAADARGDRGSAARNRAATVYRGMNTKDLADLAWVRIETPALGELTIPACSGDFLDWARSGFKAARWADGPSLVRDLLATQARPQRDAEPLGGDTASALSTADLDQVAEALVAATGVYFRRRTVAEGHGRERKIRKRRHDETDDITASAVEGGAERLKRILEAWIEDRADWKTLMARQVGLSTTHLAESAAAAAGIAKMLDDHRRFAGIIDPVPGMTAAMKAVQTPAYASLLEAVKPSQAYTSLVEAMKPSAALASLVEAVKPSPAHAALLEAMKRSPAMQARCEMLSPASGVMMQIQAQHARITEIARMATVPTTEILAGLKLYPNMAADLTSRLGIGGEMARSTKAMADALAVPRAADILGLKSLADQSAMAAAIGRQFDIRLPAATLAAMSALTTSSVIADAVRAHSFFPPGFQMAAALGLENSVARGLAADVLRYYDTPVLNAPVFAEVRESTAIVDAGTLAEPEAISFLQHVAGWLMSAIRAEPDIIRRNGLLSALLFVMAVIGCYTGIAALVVGQHSLAVAEESLAAAKAGPTHDDVEALIKETRAVREAVKAGQHGEADAHDRIRYVYDRTPLRTEPHPHGLVLRLLYPDQLLRVIEERGNWVQVEAFDYSTDAPIRGWVNRRRLRLRAQS